MVLHSFPQTASGAIVANTNYPPQSGGENTSPPIDGFMEYEDLVTMGYEGTWFDLDFLQRIPLTVNAGQVASPQTDFPILINDTYPDLIGEVEAEIRITDGDSNLLDYEIEEFDNSTGLLTAWARKPTLTDSDVLFIYFDNAGASDAQNVTGVWDSTYAMVIHMDPTLLDSTSNNNDGANSGTTDIAGKLARGRDFAGSNPQITVADSPSLDMTDKVTLSAWVKTTRNFGYVVGKEIVAAITSYFMRVGTATESGSPKIRFGIETAAGTVNLNGGTNVSSTDFSYIVATYDGAFMKVYLDGVFNGQTSQTGDILSETVDLQIGTRESGGLDMDGIIDEVRVARDVARTADYILTEFNNQNSQSTFYTTGAVQNVADVGGNMEYEV